ncbi:MAG TPA: hypothetical protein VMC43_01405 [Candidatus Paceibacterota bacterium]|nr:hypothetical protein [Candidatus Paceibacterota bacterium]
MPTSIPGFIGTALVFVACAAVFYGLYIVNKDRYDGRRMRADLDRADRHIEECLEAADRNLAPVKAPMLIEGIESEVVLSSPLRQALDLGGLEQTDPDEYEVWDAELNICEEDKATTGTGWPTLHRRWNKARAKLESLWGGLWHPTLKELAELHAELLNIEARAIDAARLLATLRDENARLLASLDIA